MDLEVLSDLLIESKELLQKAQGDSLLLETQPGNDEELRKELMKILSARQAGILHLRR